MTVPRHFRQRCAERIGPDTDAEELWRGVVWALENDRHDLVKFEARADRTGRRWFRFVRPDGREFYILIDMAKRWVPLTVLPPGAWVSRTGAYSTCLGDHSWKQQRGTRAGSIRRKARSRSSMKGSRR